MQILDHVFVLNVKKFTQRRLFMEQQLAQFSMNAEFIFKWDVEELTKELIAQYFTGDNLSKAQMSCAMKHITALKKIASNKSHFNLVLEDDAVFTKDFYLGLSHVAQQIKQFSGSKVIYIGSGGNHFIPKSKRIKGQYLYLGPRNRFADSYIIDSETAQKRLDWIALNKIYEPIDNQFDIIDKALDIKLIWLEEPIVEQGSKNGLFNSQLEERPPLWLQGLLFRWQKIRRKYIYQLWR